MSYTIRPPAIAGVRLLRLVGLKVAWELEAARARIQRNVLPLFCTLLMLQLFCLLSQGQQRRRTDPESMLALILRLPEILLMQTSVLWVAFTVLLVPITALSLREGLITIWTSKCEGTDFV